MSDHKHPKLPDAIELIGAPGSGKTTLARKLPRKLKTPALTAWAPKAKANRIANSIHSKSAFAAFSYKVLCSIPTLRYPLADNLFPATAWSALSERQEDLHPILEHAHRELSNLSGNTSCITRRVHLLYRSCLDIALIQSSSPRHLPRYVLFDESITQAIVGLALHHSRPEHFLDQYLTIRLASPSLPLKIIYCQANAETLKQRIAYRGQPQHDHLSQIPSFQNLSRHIAQKTNHLAYCEDTTLDEFYSFFSS
ncbi:MULTISPECIES: AAA family ATPase [unclassified Thioalkalivibrio]|uniref:AAA family ATPase n=1 Tax=unclassified Thioalkalivibrio TaxID=2621013 RepID=UPI0009DA163E|nr:MULTISPECIES: AAA family ATPase [unclassified Thioalkalivibrio]